MTATPQSIDPKMSTTGRRSAFLKQAYINPRRIVLSTEDRLIYLKQTACTVSRLLVSKGISPRSKLGLRLAGPVFDKALLQYRAMARFSEILLHCGRLAARHRSQV